MEWKCTGCGTENSKKFCRKCGLSHEKSAEQAALAAAASSSVAPPSVWVCGKCGAQNSRRFCIKCGNPQEKPAEAPPITAQQPPAQQVPPMTAQQPPAQQVPPMTAQQPPAQQVPPMTVQQPPAQQAPLITAQQPPVQQVPSMTVQQPPTQQAPSMTVQPSTTQPLSGTMQMPTIAQTPMQVPAAQQTQTMQMPTINSNPAQANVVFCANCSEPNLQGAKFCKKCGGLVLGTPEEDVPQGAAVSEQEPQGKHKKAGFIAGGLLTLVLVAGMTFFGMQFLKAKPASITTPSTTPAGDTVQNGTDNASNQAEDPNASPLPSNLTERYNMAIEQIDTTEYPTVKLYVNIQNQDSLEVPKNLEQVFFTLEEKTEGMDTYIKREITSVLQLNEKENLNICIVMDVSGSMSGGLLESSQNMLISFLQNVQFGYGDRLGLIAFSDDVYEMMNFTGDRTQMTQSIEQLVAMDQTSLYDALHRAVQTTSTQNGAKCVIAFTDGMDNDSSYTIEDVKLLAQQYKIPIFIIGTGVEADYQSQLSDLCTATNGYYRNIDNIGGIEEIYNDIYQKQKELYLVEYRTDTKESSALQHEVMLQLQVDNAVLDAANGANTTKENPQGTGKTQLSYRPELLISTENNAESDEAYARYMQQNAPAIIASKNEKYRINSIEFIALDITFADRFENGIARVQGQDDKWGLVDTNLDFVVPPTYDKLFYANDNMIVVCKNNRWGYINTAGEVKVPLEWDGFADADVSGNLLNKEVPFMVFSEGRGIVLKSGLYGYVDREGQVMIQPQFDEAKPFMQGLAAVKKDGKWGYINKVGEVVIPFQFEDAGSFAENRAPAKSPGQSYGYIDLSGQYAIAPRFDSAEDFESDAGRRYAKVYEDGKCGLIQTDGTYKIAPRWKEAWNYADGYAMVLDDSGKYGYVDAIDNIKLSPRYNMAYRSNMGMIAYCDKSGKWGFDDINGRAMITPTYTFVTNFSQGVARLQENVGNTTTIGIIDPSCRMLSNGMEYTIVGYPGDGYCPAQKDGEWGFVRLNYANTFLN